MIIIPSASGLGIPWLFNIKKLSLLNFVSIFIVYCMVLYLMILFAVQAFQNTDTWEWFKNKIGDIKDVD